MKAQSIMMIFNFFAFGSCQSAVSVNVDAAALIKEFPGAVRGITQLFQSEGYSKRTFKVGDDIVVVATAGTAPICAGSCPEGFDTIANIKTWERHHCRTQYCLPEIRNWIGENIGTDCVTGFHTACILSKTDVCNYKPGIKNLILGSEALRGGQKSCFE